MNHELTLSDAKKEKESLMQIRVASCDARGFVFTFRFDCSLIESLRRRGCFRAGPQLRIGRRSHQLYGDNKKRLRVSLCLTAHVI
jgi:hypothetical protein